MDTRDAGKYTVRAVNSGGEAQSIADFAVIEQGVEQNISITESFDGVTNQKVIQHLCYTFFFYIIMLFSNLKTQLH